MPTQPIEVNTEITLPAGNDEVFIVLVEKGAVDVEHGIELFRDNTLVREVLPFGKNPLSTRHSLGRTRDLRGLSTDCFGRAFYPGTRSVTFRCDFETNGEVFDHSGDAVINLTGSASSREFHIKCLFE